MIEMRRLHVSRVTVYRYAKPVAFEHRMMFIVRLTDDSWSPQEQQRFSRSAPSTNPAYPNMIEEVRFPPDLYGAFPVKRLLSGFAHSSLFGAGKAVLHPVACDRVPGARGRGQGTATLAELGGLPP